MASHTRWEPKASAANNSRENSMLALVPPWRSPTSTIKTSKYSSETSPLTSQLSKPWKAWMTWERWRKSPDCKLLLCECLSMPTSPRLSKDYRRQYTNSKNISMTKPGKRSFNWRQPSIAWKHYVFDHGSNSPSRILHMPESCAATSIGHISPGSLKTPADITSSHCPQCKRLPVRESSKDKSTKMMSVEAAPRETTELHSKPTTYVDSVAKQATGFVNVRHRTPLAEGRTASYTTITHVSMTKPACS